MHIQPVLSPCLSDTRTISTAGQEGAAEAHFPDKQTYSKSPSWYLPKAWRMTVLMAMRGFTTQNCRVAYRNEKEGMRSQEVQEGKFPNNHHDTVSTGTTQQCNTIQPQQGVWPCHLIIDCAWGLHPPTGDKGDSEEAWVLSTFPGWEEKSLCRFS